MTAGERVPVAGPSITDREIEAVMAATREAWYGGAGSFVRAFEDSFAAYLGRGHAVALPSCTAGLHLVLAALGVGPGDEVLVPDVTWIATSAPISYVGATPVFADIDRSDWCISPSSVEKLLSTRTKAIVAVDLYGSMPDMTRLQEIAEQRGVALIEDAAEAIGSSLDGQPAGSFGAASTFSFHGSKTLTTGEGGIVVTDDDALASRVRFLADHGRLPGDVSFNNREVAFKYKMTDLQAALGSAQLSRIDELVEKKIRIFGWYEERLGGNPLLDLNPTKPGLENSYWMVTVVVDPELKHDKDDIVARLERRGISSRPFFRPLSSLPAYRTAADGPRARSENEVAYELAPRGVNLPSALSLSENDVDRVCRSLLDVLS